MWWARVGHLRHRQVRQDLVSLRQPITWRIADVLFVAHASVRLLRDLLQRLDLRYGRKVAYVFRLSVPSTSSLFTLMALSVERFLATYHAWGSTRQIKVGLEVCFAIWVLCLLLSVPYWLFSAAVATVNKSGDHVYSCKVNWPNNHIPLSLVVRPTVRRGPVPAAVIAIFNRPIATAECVSGLQNRNKMAVDRRNQDSEIPAEIPARLKRCGKPQRSRQREHDRWC